MPRLNSKELYNKCFVIGCNRSGSTLLFEILRKLISSYENDSVQEKKYENFSFQLNNWLEILDVIFKIDNNYYSANGSTKFNGLDYYCGTKDEFIYIAHFPIERFHFDTIHRTYSILNDNILSFAKKYNRSLFCPMRNPLDTIVSNAFELENVLLWMYPHEINDETFADVRKNYGLIFLNNLEWFENIAFMLKRYNETHLKYKSDTHWIKYEDILNNPIQNIINIAKKINIDISRDKAGSIWDEVGFKPLTKWKTHYFKPSEGKWKKYFSSDHLKILIKQGWQDTLDKIGYNVDLTEYATNTHFNDLQNNELIDERIENYVAIRDACYSLQFGKKIQFKRNNIKIISKKISGHVIKSATNSDHFIQLFNELSDSNEILENFVS